MITLPYRLQGHTLFSDPLLPLHVHPVLLVSGDHYPHDHDFWEVVLITGGTGQHVSPRGTHPLSTGDALLLRPGTWHAYKDCHLLSVINCCFGASLVSHDLNILLERDTSLYRLLITAPLAGKAHGVLSLSLPEGARKKAEEELTRTQEANALVGERVAHLILFLSLLSRQLPQDEDTTPLHPAARQVMQLLANEITHSWTITELASHLHLAPAYLTRRFTQGVGISPMAYLARLRTERAASLLIRQPLLPVGTVGEKVGWPDANYFARRFRDHFGVSPTQYRERFCVTPPLIGYNE